MKHGTSIPRSIRLARLQHLLHRHAEGLTSRELAGLCGVHTRTIQRDLLDLQTELGVPITQDGQRYSLLGGFTLPPVFFSLYEAMALFLVSRLALRQIDDNNPHVQQALSKIAGALPSELTEQFEKSVRSFASKKCNAQHIHVFEQVATAWTARRQMRIKYQSLQATEVKEWVLEPYFVEMTGVGYSTYVIGHATREGKEGIITFKLDRIREAELLDKIFEIPAEFNIISLLSSSWGVIWGEETVVKLKFSPSVTRRVKESVWHHSQTIEDLPDGGCILTVTGSTLEMTPWIRGWGPDVEVLEPKELRAEFRFWAEQLQQIYFRE
jgi:predicted DNA-binding transcriptional regulator YafY